MFFKQFYSMALDQEAGTLYCSDDLKRVIVAYSLSELTIAGQIKCSNLHPQRLLVDCQLKRLYAASREGLLLFFDTTK